MNYPILALIVANIIWGAAVPIFKFSLDNVPPFIFLFSRFLFGAILFIPFLPGRWQKLTKKDWGEIIVCAIFGLSLGLAFLYLGLQKAPSINFPIIHSASPILIYISAVLFLKEKMSIKMLAGTLISLSGVLVIVFYPLIGQVRGSVGEIEGNLYFILGTLLYVVYVVLSKPLLKRVNAVQATFLMFVVASITYIPFALRELETWSIAQLNNVGLFGVLYGIFFSSTVAYILHHWAMSKIDAKEVGLFTYLDPVVTVLVAIPLLGEVPTPHYYIGALLVFAGIFVAEGRIHWHPLHRLRKAN